MVYDRANKEDTIMDLKPNRRFWVRWHKFPREVMIEAMDNIGINKDMASAMLSEDRIYVEGRPHHKHGSVLFILAGPYANCCYITHELIEEIK